MKKSIPRYIIIQLVQIKDKEKNLKSNQRKECKLHVNRNKDKNDRDFGNKTNEKRVK